MKTMIKLSLFRDAVPHVQYNLRRLEENAQSTENTIPSRSYAI